ncbi:helix-turn-helix domain-containing protein [Paenibacillus sp. NPDC058174]|uniref:helix-turn-helix domain-containing protein n=1 Tax=Paenibacillus sp. NPDC058174 TaxID=3346366 RepID=UPI0036DB215C
MSDLGKVLIVEDEKEIRSGLCSHPMWRELNIGPLHEADDGHTAMDIVRKRPDIRLIITDIRMKHMSGLELIQKLYEELAFDGKVIIISGYDDFQYARKAMSYGVVDFLLKPVNMTELGQVVMKALLLLEKEEKQQHSLSIMEDAMPKLRENMLQEMVEQAARGSAALSLPHLLDQYDIGWIGSDKLMLLLLEADNLKSYVHQGYSSTEQNRIMFAMGNVLEHSLLEQAAQAGRYVRFRNVSEDQWVVLFRVPQGSSSAFANWIRTFKTTIASRIKKYVKVTATIVMTPEGMMETLPDLYKDALERLTQTKIYGDAEAANELELEALNAFRDVDLLLETKALADLLKHGEEHDVREAMSLFPVMVRERGVSLLRDVHHLVFEWLLEVFDDARRLGWKNEEWRKKPLLVWEKIEAFDTVEALHLLVLDYLLKVNAELQGSPRNQILQKAEQYIQEHFSEPITVQMVADYVYLSPEWLSTLFKKNVGMTFLDYVTHLRMEKAKELLQDVSLKIYQISSEVGYRDTVYFSKLFKKKFGYTPNEYRNLKGIDGND